LRQRGFILRSHQNRKRSRSRSCYKTAQEQRTLNTAVKRRAGQEDADSDYLFANFLAEESPASWLSR
jgi:hypothetical protein